MKKVMRKVGAMLLAASMTVSLAACGSSKDESGSAKDSDGQITLTIWHQSVADTDPVKKIIEDSVEEYHELHPNITIEQDGVTGEQYKTKIKTAFAAGEAPDISYMFSGGSFVKPYIDASYLLPIDDYVSEDTLNSVLPGMLDGCTFDDKLYTLPTVTFLANLYCNTEMFEDAGAKIPTTWEELLDAIDKLNAAGYTPMILGEKDRWPGMYMYDIISARTAGNAGLEEAFGDPSKFNSKPFIEAAEKLQELVNAGAFNKNMMSMSYDEMVEGFAAGQAAMLYQANWVHPSIQAEDSPTNGKVSCIAFPVIKDGAGSITEFSGGSSDGYYINANCEHPKEAVEYLEYLSKKIGQVGYQQGAGLPCWDTTGVDTSGLTPLDTESAGLMETGTSYISWWDNILSSEDSETYKDLLAQLIGLQITPEQFCESMSKLSPSDFY
ncbi:extracellular solute-binding protein [Faecalicatena orotica]|jgi:raffinose/stachyose/melibiose transport system substrate-binding protein|uniref:Carbohydrate ABC transporter substrate-binding protein (CUT1 family) n=1 Tax=Faecalicatena orotica TaxID=1544 RepID=A0A2Y9C593_9FIRM|nr:extracellular solute-binding protein [Faecalicatena orotica]PWJ29425.1 carbohydrate ABC transporter substrate-binding protein (CUT1 family) [Faecalicatena orotica]SSA55880.1 carbohydrate ABC transporter substrate-binding protein, CUT1 family [Faecalicatena orotica]